MSAPKIAPPAIEKEREVFARRMATHLAATRVKTTWERLSPSERPRRLETEAPDRV